jgi:hypothetical protein
MRAKGELMGMRRGLVCFSFVTVVLLAGAWDARAQGPAADESPWVLDFGFGIEPSINGTLAAALGIGLRLWVAGLLLWFVGHMVAVWATKRDPEFVEVVRRHLRIPSHLNP